MKVTILNASKELTKKQQVQLKNLNAVSIKRLVDENNTFSINGPDIDYFASLHVENELSANNKEYDVFIICMTDGTIYQTGSPYLKETVEDIISDMTGEADWSIVFKFQTSKNGNKFLTANLA